jgi:hypothetical protein
MPALTAAAIAERVGWIEELGFSNADAVLLATARDSAGFVVTVHEIRATLARGCDHATAVAIYA